MSCSPAQWSCCCSWKREHRGLQRLAEEREQPARLGLGVGAELLVEELEHPLGAARRERPHHTALCRPVAGGAREAVAAAGGDVRVDLGDVGDPRDRARRVEPVPVDEDVLAVRPEERLDEARDSRRRTASCRPSGACPWLAAYISKKYATCSRRRATTCSRVKPIASSPSSAFGSASSAALGQAGRTTPAGRRSASDCPGSAAPGSCRSGGRRSRRSAARSRGRAAGATISRRVRRVSSSTVRGQPLAEGDQARESASLPVTAGRLARRGAT